MALGKRFTRIFFFVAPKNIGKVNLQQHIAAFNKAIGEVLPNDYDAFVSVGKNDYVIDTAKPITPNQARAIGIRLAKIKAIGRLTATHHYSNNRRSNQIFKSKDISM